MKFPGGFNIQQMMKQAQQMQEKMSKEMEELRAEASAGGGVVTVQMKGNHEIVSLKIDPEAVKEGDVEMLQDLPDQHDIPVRENILDCIDHPEIDFAKLSSIAFDERTHNVTSNILARRLRKKHACWQPTTSRNSKRSS